MAAYASLRRSEILNMRWDWIDFRREQITVRPSTDWHPKNYKPRTIPMNPELVEALRQAHRRLACPLVFPTPEGTVYKNIHWIEQALDRAAKRAGIEDGVGLHQLRHGFCSHADVRRRPKDGTGVARPPGSAHNSPLFTHLAGTRTSRNSRLPVRKVGTSKALAPRRTTKGPSNEGPFDRVKSYRTTA